MSLETVEWLPALESTLKPTTSFRQRLFGDEWREVKKKRLEAMRELLAASSKPLHAKSDESKADSSESVTILCSKKGECVDYCRGLRHSVPFAVGCIKDASLMSFSEKSAVLRSTVKMVAPMVRYSKLAFRLLCRDHGADLCFSPMIIADSFVRSKKARDSGFVTFASDRPLAVQFAARDPIVLGKAIGKVVAVSDGVDLNCGCPQRWAMQRGIGCYLSQRDTERIAEMLKHLGALKSEGTLPRAFGLSIKIRLNSELRKSVDLLQQLEAMQYWHASDSPATDRPVLDWVSIHGRTHAERTRAPVNVAAVRTLVENGAVNTAAVFNGDIVSANDIVNAVQMTATQGVMSARAILHNPTLFDVSGKLPAIGCVKRYCQYALQFGGHFDTHWHHLMYFTSQNGNGYMSKAEKRDFNTRKSMPAVIDFFKERGWY